MVGQAVQALRGQARAEEFNRLNYLLEYRTNLMPVKALPSSTISELELEALAFELELELLNF